MTDKQKVDVDKDLETVSDKNQDFIDKEIKPMTQKLEETESFSGQVEGLGTEREQVSFDMPPKKRWSFGKLVSLAVIAFSIMTLGFGGYYVVRASSAASDITGEGFWSVVTGAVKSAFSDERVELKGEKDGRTNILVLGVDSEAGLTDTIMIVSYYYDQKKIVMTTIPRDFQVHYKYGNKINEAYIYAENRAERTGAQTLADLLGEEFGINIHYWATANFSAVKDMVDLVDGIDVDVEKSFTDCLYPKDDYSGVVRPCPSFEAGEQHMDGKTALIYSRSRHGTNGEGSDFARSKRQTIVIQSLLERTKEKMKKLNIDKIESYLEVLGDNFETSMKVKEIHSFYQLFREVTDGGDLDDMFYRMNFQVELGGSLCNARNSSNLYVINYCDGAYIGSGGISSDRQELANKLQNALSEAKYGEVYSSGIIVLGNNSSKTMPIYEKLKSLGLSAFYHNGYSYINAADGQEQVTIYFQESSLQKMFEKALDDSSALKDKFDFDYTIGGILPESKFLTYNNKDADIIIWIE